MAELQKDALMLRIQQACFAAYECALYLDVHPYNRKALSMHAQYTREAKQLTSEYEANYGPLTIDSAAMESNGGNGNGKQKGWSWVADKWPWQTTED